MTSTAVWSFLVFRGFTNQFLAEIVLMPEPSISPDQFLNEKTRQHMIRAIRHWRAQIAKRLATGYVPLPESKRKTVFEAEWDKQIQEIFPDWDNHFMEISCLLTTVKRLKAGRQLEYKLGASHSGLLGQIQLGNLQLNKSFFHFLKDELSKVDAFYHRRVGQYTAQMHKFKARLANPRISVAEKKQIARQMPLLFKDMDRLKTYTIIHFVGLVHLCKTCRMNIRKFHPGIPKVILPTPHHPSLLEHDESLPPHAPNRIDVRFPPKKQTWQVGEELNALIRDYLHLYATTYEAGNVDRATLKLRQAIGRAASPEDVARLSWNCGITFILVLLFILVICLSKTVRAVPNFFMYFPMYRGLLVFPVSMWLWGCVVAMFQRYNLNHVFIMGLGASNLHSVHIFKRYNLNYVFIMGLGASNLHSVHIFKSASVITNIYLGCALAWVGQTIFYLPDPAITALVCICLYVGFFLWPGTQYYRTTRYWIVRILGRIQALSRSCECLASTLQSSVFDTDRLFLLSCTTTHPEPEPEQVAAPFTQVNFADFFLADILISISRVVLSDPKHFYIFFFFLLLCVRICDAAQGKDWFYTLCFIFTGEFILQGRPDKPEPMCWGFSAYPGPIIAFLPIYIRVLHCVRKWWQHKAWWPHSINTLKNSFVVATAIVGMLRSLKVWPADLGWGLWLGFNIVSACLSTFWDMVFDFGLWRSWCRGKKHHFGLRKTLFFPAWVYYVLMAFDIACRWVWLTQLVPMTGYTSEFYSLGATLLELTRRFVWCFFRVENELVNNFEGYRVVKFVPPLNATLNALYEQSALEEPVPPGGGVPLVSMTPPTASPGGAASGSPTPGITPSSTPPEGDAGSGSEATIWRQHHHPVGSGILTPSPAISPSASPPHDGSDTTALLLTLWL
ncbi:putative Xenotropic and polytropic retrovirus receptor 1 [Paratrimastix pyriformis]|uniref:Xenotropic and polytropic retrovirus receptor 1 n=1 Tax=Paratrimastix pyriformis TaxID=342808 RepID=A0ABQ8UF22_9EUKA|nr:putative Xenotropic and polytropic retrovirus receptor 1 [Paratrimastix pyriformis]